MALQDITITGSIGTYPTLSYGQKMYISSTDEESFPIETAVGGNGGSLPNLFGQTSSIDLFSPIDQKWSGYNDTPAGLVAYTESFQTEFVNGEFSGSNYVVTNGELTDPDCQQFLEVNTTLVDYSIYIYNTTLSSVAGFDSTQLQNGDFLNPNTSPNNGEIYILNSTNITGKSATFSTSTTYIKVNRFDKQGADNTLSLQELTNLRVKFGSQVIDFPILTRAEYPTYYLFQTYYAGGYTNPTYNNVLDYQVAADSSVTFSVPANSNPSNGAVVQTYYDNVYYNSLGYFDGISGFYSPTNTANTLLNYSFLCDVTVFAANAKITSSLYIIEGIDIGSQYNIVSSASVEISFGASFSTSIEFTGSFNPVADKVYGLYLGEIGPVGSSVSYDATNVQFGFNQSIPTNSAQNLTVLEPYLTQNFYYNDCNALFGNEDGLEYSTRFMQVNYDTGYIIPSNQNQIISGTAEPAPVKPYNYSAHAQILPRYNGVKVIQQNENIWTDGDVAPSKTPSVYTPSTYFAYFDWAGSTNNDLYNRQAFHIIYLVDTSGSVFTPSLNPPYYPNLIDLFPSGKKANILPYSTNGSVAQVQGTQSIYQPGVLPTPIIYTQTGSNNITNASMSFDNPLTSIPNYGSSIGLSNTSYSVGYYNILDTSPTVNFTSSLVTWNSGGSDKNLQINTSTNKTQIIPTLSVNLKYSRTSGFASAVPATLYILKYDGSSWNYIASQNILIPLGTTNFTIAAPPQIINSGDKYRAAINYPGSFGGNISQYGGTFTLTQTTPPSSQTITGPYWTTGSSSSNILTGSVSFSSNVYNLVMTAPAGGAGYFDCLPFNIQRLDEIRFEADENQVYKILSVSSPLESTDGRLYLTLDRNIDTGTDLNSFFLRRLKPDPNFVVMDTPVSPGSAGFLLPEFMSQELKDNLPNIISNLHQKNLI